MLCNVQVLRCFANLGREWLENASKKIFYFLFSLLFFIYYFLFILWAMQGSPASSKLKLRPIGLVLAKNSQARDRFRHTDSGGGGFARGPIRAQPRPKNLKPAQATVRVQDFYVGDAGLEPATFRV